MARPSSYNEKVQKNFEELLSNWKKEEYFQLGDVNQLALKLGVIRETIYYWDNRYVKDKIEYYKEFHETLRRWHTMRDAYLFEMAPEISATMKTPALAIFLLKVQAGYLEVRKVQTEDVTKEKKIKESKKEKKQRLVKEMKEFYVEGGKVLGKVIDMNTRRKVKKVSNE